MDEPAWEPQYQQSRLQDIEEGGEFSKYSRRDKDFHNLLEVVATPKMVIADGETIETTKHKRGIFAELEKLKND